MSKKGKGTTPTEATVDLPKTSGNWIWQEDEWAFMRGPVHRKLLVSEERDISTWPQWSKPGHVDKREDEQRSLLIAKAAELTRQERLVRYKRTLRFARRHAPVAADLFRWHVLEKQSLRAIARALLASHGIRTSHDTVKTKWLPWMHELLSRIYIALYHEYPLEEFPYRKDESAAAT